MSRLQRIALASLLIASHAIGNEMGTRVGAESPTNECANLCPSNTTATTNVSVRSVVPLNSLTNRFEVQSVSTKKGMTTWRTADAELRFFDGSRRLEFNGICIWMNGATSTNRVTNTVTSADSTNRTTVIALQRTIARVDAETIIAPLLAPSDPVDPPHLTEKPHSFTVILDAGHGGIDPGAVVPGMPPEKQLVLDLAKRVKKRLRQAGIKVRLTRTRDHALTLAQRPAFARKHRGSIFISIHANQASRSAARGIETFVLSAYGFPSTADTKPIMQRYPGNQHDAASLQLGYFIQRELIDQTQTIDRGVKRARFEVLRRTPCPAILVEVGFLSNPQERQRLATQQYRNRIADGITQGVRIYQLQNVQP